MLTLARRLPPLRPGDPAGRLEAAAASAVHELAGAKVGILGASSTARALITLLKPFGCDIVVYDPYLSAERAAAARRPHGRTGRDVAVPLRRRSTSPTCRRQGHGHPEADRAAARRRDRRQLLPRPGHRSAALLEHVPRRTAVRRAGRLRPRAAEIRARRAGREQSAAHARTSPATPWKVTSPSPVTCWPTSSSGSTTAVRGPSFVDPAVWSIAA